MPHLLSVLERLKVDILEVSQNGVTLNDKAVKFKFCGFLGDNLGLHQVLGFSQSFVADYWCRKCKIHREEARSSSREDPSLWRSPDNYESDLSDNFSETGITSDSILNSIPGYHVTQNAFVDVMHDVFEGVANLGMTAVIKFYVSSELFDLPTLNGLMRQFPFFDVNNRPLIGNSFGISDLFL